MALHKPSYTPPSVAANRKATARDSVFVQLPADSMTRVRFLPPMNELGVLWTRTVSHHGFKSEDDRNIAPACLRMHTKSRCFLCDLVDFLRSTGDKSDDDLAGRIRPASRWFAQVFVWDGVEYVGPKLLGLTEKTADAVNDILDQQQQSGLPFFCDPVEGHDIIITRKGSTMTNTRYSVNSGGNHAPLDTLVPGWEERVFHDMMAKIDPRIMSVEDQRSTAMRSLGDKLCWSEFEEWEESYGGR